MTSFEKVIHDKGILIYTSNGTSMLPLIREGQDVLVIGKPNRVLKKWDIVLAKRPSGRYLLHRIIRINKDNTYTLCGDNNCIFDYNIKSSEIVGVLDIIISNGKIKDLKGLKYILYLNLWCKPIYFRKICLTIRNILNLKICHHQRL